jgi:hypothetical protein
MPRSSHAFVDRLSHTRGALAVDGDLHGRRIRSVFLERSTAVRIDAAGQVGYLEADKLENVGRWKSREGGALAACSSVG